MEFPHDYTGTFGEIPEQRAAVEAAAGPPECPMFGYYLAGSTFWNAFANTLRERGLSQTEVFAQMQSKGIRYMFDGDSIEVLEAAAVEMANRYEIVDLTDE